jgi:hypothetical protein
VDQRLAQVLGAGLAVLAAPADLVCVTVVTQRARVLDGEAGELIVVVAGGVPALGDQLGGEVVRGGHGLARVVDELDLHFFPGRRVLRRGFRRQRLEFELGVPLLAVAQLLLGVGSAVAVRDHPVVLGTEGVLQLLAPRGADGEDDRGKDDQQDDDEDDDWSSGHGVPPSSGVPIPIHR